MAREEEEEKERAKKRAPPKYDSDGEEIEEEEPKLHGQLSVFTNDILNESSLEFYRGTMNQD